MSESKHTPGPWIVDPAEQHAQSGERIFKVCQGHDGARRAGGLIADTSAWWVDTMSAEANARLIAAAPDGLAMAEHFIECETLGDDGCSYCNWTPVESHHECPLTAAIAFAAKARGEGV